MTGIEAAQPAPVDLPFDPGPAGGSEMLSQEDNRRLAQLERQLRRDDPDFCARMRGDLSTRRRVPLSLALTAAVIWAATLTLALFGWWGAAAVAAVWGTVIVAALAYRCRPSRGPANPDVFPPSW
jgi:hypothetical protein